ncbi:MAG: acyl-CoA thioesterase [Bdellovibrio sp.]
MNQIFRTKKTLKFRESDPAGIMFFGNIYGFAHDAFEEFIVSAGYKYEEWFKEKEYIIPIRHSEADFLAPLIPGKTYDISVTVESFGETSFKMKYVFSSSDAGKEKGHVIVRMVHSFVLVKTMQKAPIPEIVKTRLQPYLESVNQGTN